jgi:hypothetical protein
VYQLWPHLSGGLPLEAIGAAIVHIRPDSTEVRKFSLDPDLREVVLSAVRQSIERIRQLGGKHGGHALEMADFEMTLSEVMCRQCQFKRLCQREVGR